MMNYTSWGNYFKYSPNTIIRPEWRDNINLTTEFPLLAYGKGRSYGDSCLIENGTAILTDRLNRFISFDRQSGLLRCEAGITLAEILQIITPYRWTLPVVPGTKFITLGGAIANDIHGKNHHKAGTFGCHLTQFELLRSSGERFICSPTQNTDLYSATIGGLGLTGLITWAEIQLKSVPGDFLAIKTVCFETLEDFFELNQQAELNHEYTVAWLDCQASRQNFGRGIFMRGNYIDKTIDYKPKRPLSIPCYFPDFTLNTTTIKLFNRYYYNKAKLGQQHSIVHYDPFFFPLDSLNNWNRIYGKRGFFQYQCVIPTPHAHEGIHQLLETIVQSGQGSFLSVLKTFGDIPSPGILSFPQPGVTLALDFANQEQITLDLLNNLDQIVLQFNGRVYPAKDARMSHETFQQYYPGWKSFSQHIDQAFLSSFWRRISSNL